MEAFRQYIPMDPESPEAKATVALVFINQAAPDIKRRLHRVERLGKRGGSRLGRKLGFLGIEAWCWPS